MDSGIKLSALKVDGGASANNFLMQFQSDVLDTRVERPECVETTALGAAYLAGIAVGYWKDIQEIRENWKLERTFESTMEDAQREAVLNGWHEAVKRSTGWAK